MTIEPSLAHQLINLPTSQLTYVPAYCILLCLSAYHVTLESQSLTKLLHYLLPEVVPSYILTYKITHLYQVTIESRPSWFAPRPRLHTRRSSSPSSSALPRRDSTSPSSARASPSPLRSRNSPTPTPGT